MKEEKGRIWYSFSKNTNYVKTQSAQIGIIVHPYIFSKL